MRSASVVAIAFGVWECDRCLGLGVRSLLGMWESDRCWGCGRAIAVGDVGMR
ncbi:MAG: hypothetical protein ACK5F3_17300 [Aphanizomenon sp.]